MEPVPKSHVWRSTPHKGRTYKDSAAQCTGSRAHSVLLACVMAWKFPASGIVLDAVGVLLVVVKLHSWLLGWNWLLTIWTAFKHTSCRPSTVAWTEFSNLAEGKTFALAFLRHKAGLTHTLDGRLHTRDDPPRPLPYFRRCSRRFCLTCVVLWSVIHCTGLLPERWVGWVELMFGWAGDFRKNPVATYY